MENGKLVKFVLFEVKNLIFIEGYFGIGFVGYIVVNFLVKELKMDMIGYVESLFLLLMVLIFEGKLNLLLRFYGKDNIIVVVVDIYVLFMFVNEIVKEFVNYLSEMKVEKVILMGGIGIGFFKE